MSGLFPRVDLSAVERRRMQRLTKSLPTKAAKIRALAAAGYRKPTIADFLGIRYQHVHSVLARSAPAYRQAAPAGVGGSAEPAPRAAGEWIEGDAEGPPTYGSVAIDDQGRITLPRNVIVALDGEPRRLIPWRFEDGELKLMSRSAGIRFAQDMCAKLAKEHPGSWAEELIAERRAEAARDDERDARYRRG